MIDHTEIGVADVARSAAFYDATLEALGLRRVMQLPENDGTDGIGYGLDYPVFWIGRFHPFGVKQHTASAIFGPISLRRCALRWSSVPSSSAPMRRE
jgi:catechol 2,3-dioxygenase-like lactoylglutathione lyase family enzyme